MNLPTTPRNVAANQSAHLPPARPEPNSRRSRENQSSTREWRVRVRSDDYPGTLARFAIRLADLECRILGLTRHPAPGGVLDEFVLRPAAGLPQHLLIDAFRDEGGDCLGLTETIVPHLRSTVSAETLTTEAAARELLALITETPAGASSAPDVPAASGDDGSPAATSLPLAGEPCVGADLRGLPAAEYPLSADPRTAAGEHHGPSATAGLATGEPRGEADTRESRAPATTPRTAVQETAVETTVRGLRDPAATALAAARRALVDPGCRAPMLRTVLSADLVTLVPSSEANPGRTEGGHRAVFSFGDNQAFVARRRWVAFAEPELAQAEAFLELLAAAEQNLAGPIVLDRPDGAAVVLRLGIPRDIDAIGAVHLRCSAKTLFNRYHTGLRTVPRKWLHRLLMPPRGTSLLAVCGRDVIGFGQLISQLDGTAEVSLLVEDAWQLQGIGTALLARLAALAEAGGTTELTAVRLPGNDAMVRTAVRAGLRIETSPDDETLLRLTAARPPRTVSGSRTSLCPVPRAAPASSAQA